MEQVDGMRLVGRTLRLDEAEIRLRPMEARLLATLMRSAGRPVSRAELMREVWQTDYVGDTRTLEVHICWLRRKIEEDPLRPRRIVTHRGLGYQLRIGGTREDFGSKATTS